MRVIRWLFRRERKAASFAPPPVAAKPAVPDSLIALDRMIAEIMGASIVARPTHDPEAPGERVAIVWAGGGSSWWPGRRDGRQLVQQRFGIAPQDAAAAARLADRLIASRLNGGGAVFVPGLLRGRRGRR